MLSALWRRYVRGGPTHGTIRNPILPGFNPDPSCIFVDGTFYLVTSTFLFYPGIPVYTSTDLKEWTQIGNVINRPEQYDYSRGCVPPGTQSSGGIWACTIRHHKGTFYVTTTFAYTDKKAEDYSQWVNMIFTCTDPRKNEWSDPVFFDFPGMDCSLFWDDDDKVYLTGSHYWVVRPELSQFEIDLKTGKSLSGEPVPLWSGTGGIAPEAPHIYKRHGKYYLLIAEGGTDYGHSVMIASAPTIWGPYTAYEGNPVLKAVSETSLIQTVGHADIFEDGKKQLWAVALASRVVNKDKARPIGRETVLLKVDWSGEWPVFDSSAIDLPVTQITEAPAVEAPFEDVLASDRHGDHGVRHHLLHLRVPLADTIRFLDGYGGVILIPKKDHRVRLTDTFGSPLFLGIRQRHLHFECQVELEIRATNGQTSLPSGTIAGLAVYQDPERHYAVTVDDKGDVNYVAVQPPPKQPEEAKERLDEPTPEPPSHVASQKNTQALLRIVGKPDTFTLQYASQWSPGTADSKITWTTLGTAPTSTMSNGYTGTIITVFSVPGEGSDHSDPVNFDYEVGIKGWRYRATAKEY